MDPDVNYRTIKVIARPRTYRTRTWWGRTRIRNWPVNREGAPNTVELRGVYKIGAPECDLFAVVEESWIAAWLMAGAVVEIVFD